MKRPLFAVGIWLTLVAVVVAGGPENAIVVINAKSDSSKLIGNFYIANRQIPAQNVVYLYNLPNRESINLAVCRNQILKPIIEHIQRNKLNKQIDYIIYSSDIPVKLNITKEANSFINEKLSKGVDVNKNFYKGTTSISSVTYFLQQAMAGDPSFIELDANRYFRRRNISTTQKVFEGLEQIKFEDALRKIQLGKFDDADELLDGMIRRHPRQPALYYWAAKSALGLEDVDTCITYLELAVRYGFQWKKMITSDRSFKLLLDDPKFQRFIADVPNNAFAYLPTHHFDSNYIWGRNGFLNQQRDQGHTYVLSTVLGVSRSQGNSEKEILKYLSDAIAADRKSAAGTFYFCDTKDVRNRTRRKNYDQAIAELQRLGFECSIYNGALPENVSDIAGLMCGIANFKFKKTKSKILPGAICDNLTSYGGGIEPGVGQTKFCEFLRYGAAGSCGTVREPFALQAKFPHPNMHVHYARGCTLAEAFYQAVEAPFQLLIAGDALCAPYAEHPGFEIANRQQYDEELAGTIPLNVTAVKNTPKILRFELFVDGLGVQQNSSGRFEVDTRNLDDGYHEFRVVAVADNVARSKARQIIPVVVNNFGHHCESNLRTGKVGWHDIVDVAISSNASGSVELQQNGRVLTRSKLKNGKGVLRIDARRIGRGNSSLHVVAINGSQRVASKPMQIIVEGPISEVPPRLANNGIIHYDNSDHLCVVRHQDGQWQLCSNRDDGPVWYNISTEPGDRLIAAIDLSRDYIKLIDKVSKYAGIDVGFKRSNIKVTPNRFSNKRDDNEFEIKGSFFVDDRNRRVSLGEVRGGVATAEKASGNGFVMYSERNIRSRFSVIPLPKKKK